MKTYLSIFTVLCLSVSTTSFAQTVGFEAGLSNNIQNGHYIAPCGCTFAHGSGLGFNGNVFIDLFTPTDFTIGLNSGVQRQQVTDYEVVPITLQRLANGDEQESHLTYLNIGPYVRYTIPSTAFFLRVMPEVQYLVSSEFHHASAMAEHRTTGKQTPMHSSTDDPNPVIDDLRKVRFAAKFSAGYDINIGSTIVSPVITFDLPLNTIRSNSTDDNWKISSFFGSVMARIKL